MYRKQKRAKDRFMRNIYCRVVKMVGLKPREGYKRFTAQECDLGIRMALKGATKEKKDLVRKYLEGKKAIL